MTRNKTEELRRAYGGTTPGTWARDKDLVIGPLVGASAINPEMIDWSEEVASCCTGPHGEADADFIVVAHNNMALLLDGMDVLEELGNFGKSVEEWIDRFGGLAVGPSVKEITLVQLCKRARKVMEKLPCAK